MLSRRNFLALGACSALAAGSACALGITDTTLALQLEERDILLEDLPKNFEGYRIGVLSDLHLGSWIPAELIERALSLISEADLLLLAGDYLWIPNTSIVHLIPPAFSPHLSGPALVDAVYRTVSDLISARAPHDGAFAVLGNHDRWVNPKLCQHHFESHAVRLLINETARVERGGDTLQIVGVDDYWTGIPKFPDRLSTRVGKDLTVLLCHNPDYLSELLEHSTHSFHLGVAGHTHGGQIILPAFGAVTYNIRDLRFKSGYYQHRQASVYTTRGLGVVELPWRINCPPEATLLTLRRSP